MVPTTTRSSSARWTYTRHGSELVERDRLTGEGLPATQLGPLPRVGHAIEDVRDVARVGVRLVDGVGEQRARERPFLRVRALGEQPQLRGVDLIQRDVESRAAAGHAGTVPGSARLVL
jgi:hypothetical protein